MADDVIYEDDEEEKSAEIPRRKIIIVDDVNYVLATKGTTADALRNLSRAELGGSL